MAICPFWQAPRDSERPLWDQAGRHRRRPTGSLESWTNSGKDNVSWICGGVFSLVVCRRFAPFFFISLGGGGGVSPFSKNFTCLPLGPSFGEDGGGGLFSTPPIF